MTDTRTLSDDQLETFHEDYVSPELFEAIAQEIDRSFQDRQFSFLDVGGGRGLFADKLLARFPRAEATILDNSKLLLDKNEENSRKRLIRASATELASRFETRSFDIIFFNLSLHHFVGDSYDQTRQLQRNALSQAQILLARGGRIAVTENVFDGLFISDLPGYLIYHLTASRLLAPFVKRLGANTAGCGVCFLSSSGWRAEFRSVGLRESAFRQVRYPIGSFWSHLQVRLLTVRSITRAFFWLSPDQFTIRAN